MFLDDGETVLFMDWGPGFTEDDFIGVASLRTGEFTTTNILATQPLGVADGQLIYLTVDGRIMAVPFDVRRRRVTGEPLQIVSDALGSAGGAALSPTGTLVYLRGSQNQRLVLLDSAGAHALTEEERLFATPVLSPDGQRVAMSISTIHGSETASDIWTFDRRSKTFTRVTSLGNVIARGTTSRPSETTQDSLTMFFLPFSGERKPEALLSSTGIYTCNPSLSPDSKWLAYESNESGSPEVAVRPFRSPGSRVQVSQGGGSSPSWSRDGRRVVYWHSGKLTSVTLKLSGSALEVERREPAFPNSYIAGAFDLSVNGRQLLTTLNSAQGVQLVVVKNWLTTLRARVAATKR